MVFQLVAMWLIVVATVVWFVRDERQRSASKLRLQARHFAVTPHYRGTYREPEVVLPPPLRRPTLSAADRAFFADFASKARTGA